MNLIQQLEALGQSGSLKYFGSVNAMLDYFNINNQLTDTVNSHSKELICFIEPDDDDDEEQNFTVDK